MDTLAIRFAVYASLGSGLRTTRHYASHAVLERPGHVEPVRSAAGARCLTQRGHAATRAQRERRPIPMQASVPLAQNFQKRRGRGVRPVEQ